MKHFLKNVCCQGVFVASESQTNTAELLKSNYGTTCSKFNKLKGLQGWQRGRGEDSGPFHGSIYHPWGHEPRHVTHTHEHTHIHKNTHAPLVASQTARLRNSCLWQGTYFLQQAAGFGGGMHSHVHARTSTRNLQGSIATRCNNFSGVNIQRPFNLNIKIQLHWLIDV